MAPTSHKVSDLNSLPLHFSPGTINYYVCTSMALRKLVTLHASVFSCKMLILLSTSLVIAKKI